MDLANMRIGDILYFFGAIHLAVKCLVEEILRVLATQTVIHITRPLMVYHEIIIIEEILKRMKPKTCLEWGAGNSTLFFPKYLEKNARWIAIEHDKKWFNFVRDSLTNPDKVTIYYVPPNSSSFTDPYHDGAYSDFEDYVMFPKKLKEKFDFILIDGRARNSCLAFARHFLNDHGVVVLHDANRRYYHEPCVPYHHKVLFRDFRDIGGLWIGSKRLNIYNILDVYKHELIWRILERCYKLANVFSDTVHMKRAF